ncbi:MAG: DUF4625 domain-containing protein [Paludibacter sp.]|jgi:hypothetical protein|nr:DUF4625 domain-containing protein [Paludibacter sp.]
MKKTIRHSAVLLLVILSSCGDLVKDEQTPAIDITATDAFPKNCVTVYRGESFDFKIRLSDNMELGSFSVQMHHNFDHHTHSTSATQCDMDPVKNAVNPLLYIDEYPIPEKLTEYVARGTISIPANVDTGDYHFTIRVTDAAGWQSFEGISVKIGDR